MAEKKENIIQDMDVYEIQQYQQNRYPLLFIDKIIKVIPGKSAIGYKNFTYNEWFFPAHFEDEPNVPGFIQIEALTQNFLMTFLTLPGNKGKKTGFVSIKNAIFKRKIVPGDRFDIESELKSYRRGLAKGSSLGYVNGEVACAADLVIAIPDILNQYTPVSK
ncbi:MAG: beta-hydroxyacyl-ACP dehydratase [Lentisphaeria bacterium]|nr:beta-hydroxyacyl-ACP dehydratase [Lentisphaeria bacterium]NQZ70909.1 beta-hydroxyacyl-ACP dehydratase [Lentisphaeria bacterium]